MKRLILSGTVACLLFGLTACSDSKPATPKATELTLNTEYSVSDYAEFTLRKICTTDRITAPMGGGSYENDNDGETYIDAIFDFKNTGTEEVNTEDIVSVTATTASGTNYFGDVNAIETNNSTWVSSYENISPMASVRLHTAVSIPKTETDFILKFSVNGEVFTIPYTVGDVIRNVESLAVGNEIKSDDFAKFTFKGIEYTDVLLPHNTNGFYTYHETDNADNTFLVVKYDIMNLQKFAKNAETFVGIKAVYMNKYTYDGYVVVEQTDGTGFDSYYESIAPLTERHFYYLIEVPKTVAKEAVELTIYFDGQEYLYTE